MERIARDRAVKPVARKMVYTNYIIIMEEKMATTQDYLQKSSDGTAVSHLDDSIVYHDTTNSRIGISTSSPADKFDVKGNVRVTNTADAYPGFQILNYNHDNMALNFDSYYEGGWKSGDSGSNFRIYKVSDTLRFSYASGVNQGSTISDWSSENSNCAISINNTGSIGIGLTSPNGILHLYGGTGSGGTGDCTNITSPIFRIQAGLSYWRIPHISNDGSISGVYNYQTGKDVYWGESTDTGKYYFRGRDFVADAKMGIGVTPAKRLSVYDSSATQAVFYGYSPEGSSSTDGLIQIGNHETNFGRLHYGSSGILTLDNTCNNGDADIKFRTKINGTAVDAITIKGGGSVGIGTTDPKVKLHSTGSTIVGANTSAVADGDLGNSQVNIYVDETNNKLKFKVKYSTGTVKSGEILLT